MIRSDTIKLLRECDAGIRMGVAGIDEVLDKVAGAAMKNDLKKCRQEHLELEKRTEEMLHRYGDGGKEPNPVAKGMSRLKTGVMLSVKPEDATVADLMTQGANMGVKSLNRYLNQYEAAEEEVKDIAKKLIALEDRLVQDMRRYL